MKRGGKRVSLKRVSLLFAGSLLTIVGVLVGFCSIVLAQETPGVTRDTIRIGLIGPITGPGSLWGDLVDSGSIAMYQEVNRRGGVHGRKIEIIHEDDRCDPETGKSAVKKVIYQDKVFMIQAFVCALAGLAAKQDIINVKIPWMINAATADSLSRPVNRYIFQPALTGEMDGEQAVKFIMTKPGAKRIAIVYHKDDWAEPRVRAARETLKKVYNLTFVAEEEMARGSTDATVQVLKIKQAKPDSVLVHLYPAESALFIRDAFRNGLEATFMGCTATTDLIDFVKRVGVADAVKYMYAPAQEIDSSESSTVEWLREIYARYFPGKRLQSLSILGMGIPVIVVEGLKRAGPNLTREGFIDALQTLKDFDTKILASPVTFTPDDHNSAKKVSFKTLIEGKEVYLKEPKWPGVKKY